MIKPKFPLPEQIQEVVKKIEERLSIKQINSNRNFEVKEGLKDCLRILNGRLQNPENPYFWGETEEENELSNEIYRKQLKDISKLKTIRGRAIAIMCVDWLNGKEQAIEFLSIPFANHIPNFMDK